MAFLLDNQGRPLFTVRLRQAFVLGCAIAILQCFGCGDVTAVPTQDDAGGTGGAAAPAPEPTPDAWPTFTARATDAGPAGDSQLQAETAPAAAGDAGAPAPTYRTDCAAVNPATSSASYCDEFKTDPQAAATCHDAAGVLIVGCKIAAGGVFAVVTCVERCP